eukprot:g2647.t1
MLIMGSTGSKQDRSAGWDACMGWPAPAQRVQLQMIMMALGGSIRIELRLRGPTQGGCNNFGTSWAMAAMWIKVAAASWQIQHKDYSPGPKLLQRGSSASPAAGRVRRKIARGQSPRRHGGAAQPPETTDNIAALSANELAASALVLARGHGLVGVKTLKTVDKALDKWFPLPANLTCSGTEDCDKKGVTESFGHAWGTFVNIEPYLRPTGAGLSVCASATDGGGSAPVSQFFFQELCAQAPRLRVPQPLRVGGLINWRNICIVHPVNTSAGNSFKAGFPFWEKAGWTEAYYLSRLRKEIGAINYARVYIADYLSDHGLNEMSLVSAHGRQRAQVLRDVMARKKFPYYLVDDLVEGFAGFLCKNVRDDVFSAVAPPSLTRWTTVFNPALRVDIADAVADWSTDILSHFNGIYTNQGSTWLWKERT